METIVLSGPADQAAQARQMLKQQGLRVEESLDPVKSHNHGQVTKRDYDHGFDVSDGETFITCYGDVNAGDEVESWGSWAAVKALGFELRMHWVDADKGEWQNDRAHNRDPFTEIDRLVAALRAAGIVIPDDIELPKRAAL